MGSFLSNRPAILRALEALRDGDFDVQLDEEESNDDFDRDIARVFNQVVQMNKKMEGEVKRIAYQVGKQGQFHERFRNMQTYFEYFSQNGAPSG